MVAEIAENVHGSCQKGTASIQVTIFRYLSLSGTPMPSWHASLSDLIIVQGIVQGQTGKTAKTPASVSNSF